jgi:hypothetical protein
MRAFVKAGRQRPNTEVQISSAQRKGSALLGVDMPVGMRLVLAPILLLALLVPKLHSQNVKISPSGIYFGNELIKTSSAPKTITITNSQPLTLSIRGIAALGNFTQTNTCIPAGATSGQLAARASCTISATFTPASTGNKTGLITVIDDAAGSPQKINLHGTGVGPASFSATTFAFGNQRISTTSAAKAVTAVNNQAVVLKISSITTTGTFGQTNNCPAALKPNTSCVINLTLYSGKPRITERFSKDGG